MCDANNRCVDIVKLLLSHPTTNVNLQDKVKQFVSLHSMCCCTHIC